MHLLCRVVRAIESAAEALARMYEGVAGSAAAKALSHLLLADFVGVTTAATAGDRAAAAPVRALPLSGKHPFPLCTTVRMCLDTECAWAQ